MKKSNKAQLLKELEQIPSPQLTQMLHAELKKDRLDDELIRTILQVQEAREENHPPIDEDTRAAWEQLQNDWAEDAEVPARKKPKRVLKIAALAAVLCLVLLAIPDASGSNSFFDRVGTWKDSVLEFFKPTEVQQEYIFQTDHPGLQKVYDEVVALGVTQSVVPTWIPEEYKLTKFNSTNTPTKITVYALFTEDVNAVILRTNIYGVDAPRQYEIDDADAKKVELSGIDHFITENDGAWMAVWSRDNVECALTVDCQEDIFYKILESIYVTEAD